MARHEIASPRAVGIVQREDRTLLIHRRKQGREYYVLPGGSVEEGESPADACLREIREETSLDARIHSFLGTNDNEGRVEHYFAIRDFDGALELGSPEKERQNADNEYKLEWIAQEQLSTINLQPSAAAKMIMMAMEGI